MPEIDPSDFLNFQIQRNVTVLFKSFLSIIEDFKSDGVLSEEYFQRLRKKILGQGNDCIRELNDFSQKFDIKFKK